MKYWIVTIIGIIVVIVAVYFYQFICLFILIPMITSVIKSKKK